MEPVPTSNHPTHHRVSFRVGTTVAVLVLLAGALAFAQLQRIGRPSVQSEIVLHTVGTHVNRMNALEWEAIAMGELTIESNAEWREAREEAERALQTLIEQPGADATGQGAGEHAPEAYGDSIVREFALIRQGKTRGGGAAGRRNRGSPATTFSPTRSRT